MPNMEAEGNGPTKKEVQRSKEDHKEESKKSLFFLKWKEWQNLSMRERERERALPLLCLFGVKIGRMENTGKKIGWKMLFFPVRLEKENGKDEKPGENFLSWAHIFNFLPWAHIFCPPKLGGKVGKKSAATAYLHNQPLPPTLMTLSPIPPDDFCLQIFLITFSLLILPSHSTPCPTIQVLLSLFFFLSLFMYTIVIFTL